MSDESETLHALQPKKKPTPLQFLSDNTFVHSWV